MEPNSCDLSFENKCEIESNCCSDQNIPNCSNNDIRNVISCESIKTIEIRRSQKFSNIKKDTTIRPKSVNLRGTNKPFPGFPLQFISNRCPRRPLKWECKSEETKKHKFTDSPLDCSIGVSFGTINLKNIEVSKQYKLQSYANCLIAVGELFLTPEIEWNSQVINSILSEGKQLLLNSQKENENGILNEDKIIKTFSLSKNTIELYISEPIVIGRMKSDDPKVLNLRKSLTYFLRLKQFCLLLIDSFYFLLWKNFGVYFLFDCHGRTRNCEHDMNAGHAALINFKSIRNLYKLISTMPDLKPDSICVLREIKITNLVPCCENVPVRKIRSVGKDIEIINDEYAILRGQFHIGSECFQTNRHRHALPVACTSILYSKIDPACTWNSSILDRIVLIGNELCKSWSNCDYEKDLSIQDVPANIILGQFKIRIVVFPFICCGISKCLPDYKNNDLFIAIKDAFRNYSNLLLEINRKIFSLWKCKSIYYIFDPYPETGASTLHMSTDLDFLCCILIQQILKISEAKEFHLHLLKILDILKNPKSCKEEYTDWETHCNCINNKIDPCIEEAISLNESICDIKCPVDLNCTFDKKGMGHNVVDLDSPALSETQIIPTYKDIKKELLGGQDDTEEGEEEDEEGEDDETSSEDDEDDSNIDVNVGGKKNKKKKANQKDAGKGKGKGKKSKKSKNKGEDSSDDDDSSNDDSDEEGGGKDNKNKKGKAKKGKEKDKKKGKGKGGKGEDGSDGEDDEDGKGGKDKKTKDKGKKDKGKTKKDKKSKDENESDDETDDESGKKGGKDKKGKKDKNKDQKENDKQKQKEKKEKEGKKDKEKEKKDKDKKDKDKKGKDKDGKDKDGKDKDGKDKDGKNKDGKNKDEKDIDEEGENERSDDESDTEVGSVIDLETSNRKSGPNALTMDYEEGCIPNKYPGYSSVLHNLAVAASQNGNYSSFCTLLKYGFKCADRILVMTPWGNYVVFKSCSIYLLYDGCTCDVDRFRRLDLTVGTAGLICFTSLHDLISEILKGQNLRCPSDDKQKSENDMNFIDEILEQYC